MPTTPGFTSNGLSTANQIVGTGTSDYNFVQFTPLSWVSNAFLCYRGSVNRTFNIVGSTPVGAMRCYRVNDAYVAKIVNTRNDISASTNSKVSRAALYMAGSAGQALTDQRTNAGLNVQFPMFTNSIFQSTDPSFAEVGNMVDGSYYDSLGLTVDAPYPSSTAVNQLLNSYVAAGTDYSLHFFLNVPTVWLYNSEPTAV